MGHVSVARPSRTQAPDHAANAPRAAAGPLAALVASGPRQAAQARLATIVNGGPRLAAQRAAVQGMDAGKGVVQGAFFDEAKVGLELTFQNAHSRAYFTNTGIPTNLTTNAKAWWDTTVRRSWARAVEANDIDGLEKSVNDKVDKNKNFGHGTGELDMTRFTYKSEDEGNDFSWWWQLSADPGVVEIQSQPATGQDFNAGNEISTIVTQDIFGKAGMIDTGAVGGGLAPGGGGGHLNVDFETGFGGNYDLIAKVLAQTEERMLELFARADNDAKKQLVDWDNQGDDPFIATERTWVPTKEGENAIRYNEDENKKDRPTERRNADWKSKVYDKRGKKNSQHNFEAFRENHAKWLFAHPSARQYLAMGTESEKFGKSMNAEEMGKVLHYQAVNIDHILAEKPEERRLEFRFLGAQTSLADIVAGIRLLAKITAKAKERRD